VINALKVQFKVALRSWINILLVLVVFAVVLWLSGVGGGFGVSDITRVGVYVPSPVLRLVVQTIPGIVVFASPDELAHAVSDHRVLLGVDMEHRVIYAWGILPKGQRDALVWLASGMWRTFTGHGIRYVDEVWWDPFAGDFSYAVKGMVLMLLFPLDVAFIYITLLSRAKMEGLFQLWETLGVGRLKMHLAMVIVAVTMAGLAVLPLFIRQPGLLALVPWVVVLTFVTLGLSAGFVRLAHSSLMALLSVIPPIALAMLGITYAMLPGDLPFATWIPWTYASLDLLKLAGAEGSVPMPVAGWLVGGLWLVVALALWVWGGAGDETTA